MSCKKDKKDCPFCQAENSLREKASKIFNEQRQKLSKQDFINFLSYCYGVLAHDITEQQLDSIKRFIGEDEK